MRTSTLTEASTEEDYIDYNANGSSEQKRIARIDRPARRGPYTYALHGIADHDLLGIGDNEVANGDKRENRQSGRSKPKRTKAESDQSDAELEEQINGPAWITCYKICTRMAGGDLRALLLSRMVFWFQLDFCKMVIYSSVYSIFRDEE